MKKSFSKIFTTVSAAIIFASIVGGNAVFAEVTTSSPSTSANITGGTLSMDEMVISNFKDESQNETIKLDGTKQEIFAEINDITIKDPTGTGNGWNVMVEAGRVTSGDNDLGFERLFFQAPVIEAGEGSSPANTITTYGGFIDKADASSLKVLSAVADGGMGAYTIDFAPLKLTLNPSEVYTGNYSTTVKVTLTTGP
ncbi:WxL domain-containing protein [Oceanobacillus bengalensis]|uniref:WxL domain-containing protein n=1 Tax=Oceanobacillus bengalensis TaxID=1435466 RepID=A0A494YS09_9BACI|nr:WxL domain-containing protein [Oceanobacillus bengalensis]RKQ12459.1 hypothetical protein D8M05_18145 [Oceanobacillus bengalensis]